MAQAILLEDVKHLGQRGEPVEVSPGYLRNYLIPRKLAAPATAGALEQARQRQAAAEKAAKARTEREEQSAELLSKTVLTIQQRADDGGRLFGSVGSKEIAEAIRAARDLRVDRRKIRLDQPIREVGTHMVEIELADGAVATVKTIVAEES